MTSIPSIIIRALLAVFTLQLLARINGPKQISQLSFYDYITGITIGSMAAYMAVDEQIPLIAPMVAIAVFVSASYLENQLSLHSLKARKLIDGVPMLLMADGKLLRSHMKKAHLSVNDLLSEARVAGYFDLSKIAFALMETSGKISFLPYAQDKQKAPALFINVIIDGEILPQELALIQKDRTWLLQKLKEHHLSLSDVLLASADSSGRLICYPREIQTKATQIFL